MRLGIGPLSNDRAGDGVWIGRGLVRDVLHEQQSEDVVLVLGGVHAASQLVAALPQRPVQVRLLERHYRAILFEGIAAGGWPVGLVIMVCCLLLHVEAWANLRLFVLDPRYRRPRTLTCAALNRRRGGPAALESGRPTGRDTQALASIFHRAA